MKVRALAIALLLTTGDAAADENAVAYRLYEQGRFSEAAEIFTDPAWKGVAMYRSDQYWRAAEAFVRADDAVSIYNLGNCYARLGYYELALQAYLNAGERDPALLDATANADVMRRLIAARDGEGRQGLQPKAQKIDEADARPDEKGNNGEQGEETGKAEQRRNDATGDDARQSDAQAQAADGKSGAGADRRTDEGLAGQADVAGRQGETDPADNASGGSESDSAPRPDQAAGMRNRLEAEQATEQWLNRIRDEPAKFLKARIALEALRRAASGNAPPAGGSTW